jgi:hypothetical protein
MNEEKKRDDRMAIVIVRGLSRPAAAIMMLLAAILELRNTARIPIWKPS